MIQRRSRVIRGLARGGGILLRGRLAQVSAVEASLIALHAVLYLTVVLLVLSPVKALAFVAVQQAVFSVYLGISFAPNHKGMPLVEPATAAGYARRQVTTARNISGGPLTTFLLGGLNYQIEHHLFPNMPRVNLRHAQPLVQQFCAHNGISYSQTSALASYQQVLSHLHAIGAPLRRTRGQRS